jgi:hypothetical protein
MSAFQVLHGHMSHSARTTVHQTATGSIERRRPGRASLLNLTATRPAREKSAQKINPCSRKISNTRKIMSLAEGFWGMSLAQPIGAMDIRFISTLTSDDEDALAAMLLDAARSVLDEFPLAYTLRIETTARTVYQHHHPDHQPASANKSGRDAFNGPPIQQTRRVPIPHC